MFKKDCSPGPGYFIDASIIRTGRDGTPSYSILGRQKDPSKSYYFTLNTQHIRGGGQPIPIYSSIVGQMGMGIDGHQLKNN